MVSLAFLSALAGALATLLFVASALPMLVKAARTRDLSSYSPGNLVISNVGNACQTVYIASLQPGPLWALHGFNVGVSALMLAWWLQHYWIPRRRTSASGLTTLEGEPS